MKSFEVIEDGIIPEYAQEAYQSGEKFYVDSAIGWIECDEDPLFLKGVVYGIKE